MTIQELSFSDKPIKYLCIAAHFDDVEFMAYSVISSCLDNEDGFAAMILTDGSGSARSGQYSNISDSEMVDIRVREQIEAAKIGQYSNLTLLMQSSNRIKDSNNIEIAEAIFDIIVKLRPQVVYTHNLFDKHPTHVAVASLVVKALRMQQNIIVNRLVGCEVWRGLDWIDDAYKIAMDTSCKPGFAKRLMGVFKSQIEGGKNYDNAIEGRWLSNATFYNSHSVDGVDRLSYGIDMTELITDKNLKLEDYVNKYIESFRKSIISLL